MSLTSLFSKVKDLASSESTKATIKKLANSDAAKKVVKKVSNNKTIKSVAKKATNVAKSMGIDTNTILSYAQKNKTVIEALTKLGLKKGNDPASTAVQKLVSSLKTSLNKATGMKFEDKSFGSTITKLLAVEKVKEKLESAAGKGVISFIKKSVSEYIS